MKVTFLGAAHEVTGSCTLLEVGDKKGVIDCGMEQGTDLFENQELPVAAGVLDFVLVTHAHIDHSGLLPLLYKNGFRGAVYATAATCSLLDIMLPGLDGYELLDYIRPMGIPVIFVTAKSQVKDRVQGLKLGADDYITKP